MRDFRGVEKTYLTDAPFNKMVNLFIQLIEEFGFLPSEIREGLFYAQYRYESSRVSEIIRTEKDWEQIEKARELMKSLFLREEDVLK